MRQTMKLDQWLTGTRQRSAAKRKAFVGVTVLTAADMLQKSRVTVWKWIADGKLDAIRILDAGGREVAVLVTLGSIERLAEVDDQYSAQILLDV